MSKNWDRDPTGGSEGYDPPAEPKPKRVANTVAYVVFDDKGRERGVGWSAEDAWEQVSFIAEPWVDIEEPGTDCLARHNRLVGEAQNRGWRCIVHDLVSQEAGPPWIGDEQEGHGQQDASTPHWTPPGPPTLTDGMLDARAFGKALTEDSFPTASEKVMYSDAPAAGPWSPVTDEADIYGGRDLLLLLGDDRVVVGHYFLKEDGPGGLKGDWLIPTTDAENVVLWNRPVAYAEIGGSNEDIAALGKRLAEGPMNPATPHPFNTTTQEPRKLEIFVATVQLAVAVPPGTDAQLAAEEILGEALHSLSDEGLDEAGLQLQEGTWPPIIDWSYLHLGGQYLHPTSTGKAYDPKTYQEGDAF